MFEAGLLEFGCFMAVTRIYDETRGALESEADLNTRVLDDLARSIVLLEQHEGARDVAGLVGLQSQYRIVDLGLDFYGSCGSTYIDTAGYTYKRYRSTATVTVVVSP